MFALPRRLAQQCNTLKARGGLPELKRGVCPSNHTEKGQLTRVQ